jgi:hypothetical protein
LFDSSQCVGQLVSQFVSNLGGFGRGLFVFLKQGVRIARAVIDRPGVLDV